MNSVHRLNLDRNKQIGKVGFNGEKSQVIYSQVITFTNVILIYDLEIKYLVYIINKI